MRRVILESRYAGDIEGHKRYARAAMRDCMLNHGEAPFASHLLYADNGVMEDLNAEERAVGMEAGFVWGAVAEATVVYVDLGISVGMIDGINRALQDGRDIEFRRLPGTSATALDFERTTNRASSPCAAAAIAVASFETVAEHEIAVVDISLART